MTNLNNYRTLIEVMARELDRLPFEDLNRIFGSVTCDEIHKLSMELATETFREQRNIATYEEMTEEDLEEYYLEKYEV